MGLPRRWTHVHQGHAQETQEREMEDGIFDVDVDGGCSARLYRADDDGKPVGESLARRCLTKSEMTALEEGDPVNDFEGHNIQPDEEHGDESSAPPAAAAPAGAPATRPLARPRGAPSTRYVNPLAAPAVALAAGRPPGRAEAATHPGRRRAPSETQRANAPTSRTAAAAAADDDDMDDGGCESNPRGVGSTRQRLRRRIRPTCARRVSRRTPGERVGARVRGRRAGGSLAKRRSKWEAYAAPAAARHAGGDSNVCEATKTSAATTAAAGGFGDVAAALRAAGGGGLGVSRRSETRVGTLFGTPLRGVSRARALCVTSLPRRDRRLPGATPPRRTSFD